MRKNIEKGSNFFMNDTIETKLSLKMKAALKFIHSIKPGHRAELLAFVLTSVLKLAAPRKKVAEANIALVFPDKSEAERRQILNESYESMALTATELLTWQRDPSLIETFTEEVIGIEQIGEAFEKGRGIIFIGGHIGNWEHTGAWGARHARLVPIVRHNDSPFLKSLVSNLRGSSGMKVIGKDESMLKIISVLKKNMAIGIMPDQYGGNGKGSIKAPLFGYETGTAQGPAIFASLTGAPMLTIQTVRMSPFRFKLIIGGPIMWEKEGSKDGTLKEITAKVNGEIETMIKRVPGQWLWQHRRFRDVLCY